MKIITIIARTLLGLGFCHIQSEPSSIHCQCRRRMPQLVLEFMDAVIMIRAAFMKVVGAFQLAGGLLLLIGRFVPVGLSLLGPVLVNILMFHFLVMQGGYMIPLVFAALWLVVFAGYWKSFESVFKP